MNKRELRIALERVDPLSHNSFDDLLDELYDELQAAQAPASGEVEPVGYLNVEHFRDDPNMQNVDYEHIGAVMKPGRHRLFTHPPAKVPEVDDE